jgi:hypothetical protein
MISAIIVGLLLSDPPITQFEHDLGFELPAPYTFVAEGELLTIECSGNLSACPDGELSSWQHVGYIGTGRDSGHWGSIPPIGTLLIANGWHALRPAESEPVTTFVNNHETKAGICSRYLTMNGGYTDAVGIIFIVLPCQGANTQ